MNAPPFHRLNPNRGDLFHEISIYLTQLLPKPPDAKRNPDINEVWSPGFKRYSPAVKQQLTQWSHGVEFFQNFITQPALELLSSYLDTNANLARPMPGIIIDIIDEMTAEMEQVREMGEWNQRGFNGRSLPELLETKNKALALFRLGSDGGNISEEERVARLNFEQRREWES